MSLPTSELAQITVEMQPLDIPENWLIGPRSFLVDRIVPNAEQVLLPSTTTGGGKILLEEGIQVFRPSTWNHKNFLFKKNYSKHRELAAYSKPVVDLRSNNPSNWAHFLNNHLALLAVICRETNRHWSEYTILLPALCPPYIRQLADLIELDCVFTDHPVRTYGVRATFENITILRGERNALLGQTQLSPIASFISSRMSKKCEHPKKIFIGRKDTRRLTNHKHVADYLLEQGYVEIFAEDLSVAEQIFCISQADEIVAIHGAALAPIIYRLPYLPPLRLIEIFPVGHITNCYRAFSAAMNAPWCGVRGHLEKRHIKEIYSIENGPYSKHSLSNFSVDLASLEVALSMIQCNQGIRN